MQMQSSSRSNALRWFVIERNSTKKKKKMILTNLAISDNPNSMDSASTDDANDTNSRRSYTSRRSASNQSSVVERYKREIDSSSFDGGTIRNDGYDRESVRGGFEGGFSNSRVSDGIEEDADEKKGERGKKTMKAKEEEQWMNVSDARLRANKFIEIVGDERNGKECAERARAAYRFLSMHRNSRKSKKGGGDDDDIDGTNASSSSSVSSSSSFKYVSSETYDKMQVRTHHGPFWDLCANARDLDLAVKYFELFDPKDDKRSGGRLANAFMTRMTKEIRNKKGSNVVATKEGNELSTTANVKRFYRTAKEESESDDLYFSIVKKAFENSLVKNEYIISAFLKACGKANRLQDAKEVFENAKKKGTPTSIVFRAFIDCCASCGDCDSALKTFEAFKVEILGKDERLRDDTDAVRAFNGMLSAAKNARNVQVAKRVFKELTEDFTYLAPTEVTYATAITAAANAYPKPDLEFALELFNRSKKDPTVQGDLDKFIVSATLSSLQRSLAAGSFTGTKEKAVLLAKTITRPLLQQLYETENERGGKKKIDFVVSSQVFSALVSVYARANDVESALETIALMQNRGFSVDRHILTSALTACRPSNDYSSAAQLLKNRSIAERGVDLYEKSNKNVRETSSVASAAMFLYFYLGDTRKAQDLYDKVKLRTNENNSLDNQILFNTMLLHCAKKKKTTSSFSSDHDAIQAMSIFQDMRRARVPATERTYSLMLTVLGTQGTRFADVENVYKLASSDPNVILNDFMKTAWMDANVKANRVDEALLVYDSIIDWHKRENGNNESDGDIKSSPSIVTFGSALSACWTERENIDDAADKAYKIFADMAKFNVVPNDWCGNLFVKVISRAGRVEDTLSELKAIIKCGGSIQDDTLEGVVRALCRAGYAERALRVYKWLRSRQSDDKHSMKPSYCLNRETFQDMVQSCADNGFLTDAWNLVDRHKMQKESSSIVEELGELAMGSLFKAVARNAEVVNQDIDFMSKTKAMAKLALESNSPELFVSTDVLCILVEAFARFGDLESALDFWETYENRIDSENEDIKRISKNKKKKNNSSYQKDTPQSKMYGAIIDECCRQNEVSSALSVFDKAKDAEVGLSTVTLAFLESCCRRSKVDEWRVFDVCAQMRIQSEKRKAMKNPEIARHQYSHHVQGDLESSDDPSSSSSSSSSVINNVVTNAIEDALEQRSSAASGKREKRDKNKNRYKSNEEMSFFNDEFLYL